MPVLGVGTDILFVPRILSLLQRRTAERVASRILCPREYQLWHAIPSSNSQSSRFLAVRWSVKEATYKALQPDWRLTWKQLSFLEDSTSGSRKPVLQLGPDVTSINTDIKLHVSVSHDGDYITAMVVAEEPVAFALR